MRTEARKEMLARTVGSVFVTMLGLEVSPSEVSSRPAGDLLTSYVQLSGDWNGAVLLQCTRRQACSFTGLILSEDPPTTVDDDVRDVLGELANVIGGNMKCSMSTVARLSMPKIVEGGEDDCKLFERNASERLTFQSSEGRFWVSVVVEA
jgi:CheY-specific phosphatase CheX